VVAPPPTAATPATAADVLRKLLREIPLAGVIDSDIPPPSELAKNVPFRSSSPMMEAAAHTLHHLTTKTTSIFVYGQCTLFVKLSQVITTIINILFFG